MRRVLGAIGCSIAITGSVLAADGQWSSTSSGSWSDSGNWNGGVIASGTLFTASFTATGSGAITVNNDIPDLALNGIVLGGGGFVLTGSGVLLDAGGMVQVAAASHTVALPLALQGDLNYTIGSGLLLEQSGAISGDGGIALAGGRLKLAAAANTYTGRTAMTTGVLQFSDPAQLGASDESEANLVLGDGTLHYSGPAAVMSRGVTLNPAPGTDNRAAVIRVEDALAISGKMASISGAFIKTGPGTLNLTYPGDHRVAWNSAVNEGTNLIFNSDGSAGAEGFSAFVVDDGRMVISGPDQIARFNAAAFVGARSPRSPELVVSNSTVYSTGGWWSLGRGNGTVALPQSSTMKLLEGAYMEIQGSGLVLGNANGSTDYKCYISLLVDDSHLKVNSNCYVSENPNAISTVVITNGGHLNCSSESVDAGLDLSRSAGPVVMRVTDNASLTAHSIAVRETAELIVENGASAYLFNTHSFMFGAVSGKVLFNSGSLYPRNQSLAPNWFAGMGALSVGSGGMTIGVNDYAFLDAAPLENPADTGGVVYKTGAGQLALRAPQADLTVQSGSVSFPYDDPVIRSGRDGTLSFAEGTSIEVSGARALADLTLPPAAQVQMRAHSLTQNPKLWSFNSDAKPRNDGFIHLVNNNTNRRGSSYLKERKDFAGPWTVSFCYSGFSTYGNPADGFCLIIHNAPEGAAAIGDTGSAMAFEGAGGPTNSIAVGWDIYNKRMRFGKQRQWRTAVNFPAGIPNLALLSGKTLCTVVYDGMGTLQVKTEHPSFGLLTYSWAVDIPLEIGDDLGYLGFGSGTGGAAGQHMISDVSIDNGASAYTPDYCVIKGGAVLGSAESISFDLFGTSEQQGFIMDSLTYADQAVLDLSSPVLDSASPALSLDDQSAWKLMGVAHWLADGRVATSINVNDGRGAAYCYNSYDLLSSSWELKFSYDMGLDKDPTAADAMEVVLMSNAPDSLGSYYPPGDACRFEWRYYEGTQRQTQLKVLTNSVKTTAASDLAPVDLQRDLTANMTISYDKPTDTVTVITESSAGSYVKVMPNFDLAKALKYSDVYIGFYGNVGGLQCENIIGNASLTISGVSTGSAELNYLAFNELSGSGTLLKTGSASLGIAGDIDAVTGIASVEVQEGGLVLAKRALEPASMNGAGSDWVSGNLGIWGKDGSFQFTPNRSSISSTAHFNRRVCVSAPWTITYDFFMDRKSSNPADAYALFLHNDPRGVMALGGITGNAGYGPGGTGKIVNSVALRWYFYQGNETLKNTSEIGKGGDFAFASTRQSFAPVLLANGITRTVVSYDPATQILQCVLTQGAAVVTNTFTAVDIAALVGGDYAWLGFGGGTGGHYADLCVDNLTMSYGAALNDPTAVTPYLAKLIVPADVAVPVYLHRTVDQPLQYRLSSVEIGDQGVLKVGCKEGDSFIQPAALVCDAWALSGVGVADVNANARCLVESASGDTLKKTGSGTLEISGPSVYTGSTVLEKGTLSLPAANLPEATALFVTSGAELNLQFTGKQYVDTLTVDGIPMPGGLYNASNTPWIEGTGILMVRNPAVGTVIIVR